MYLVFDTETTGLPKSYQAPLDDFANWPRLVQIAWQTYDDDGNLWERHNYIIKPEGFIIPEEVTKIHRISHDRALREGKDLKEILQLFVEKASRAAYLVGHNIEFDENIVGSELLRQGWDNIFHNTQRICTMKTSATFCAISNGRGGYKWPNLGELHRKLFDQDFADAHDADVDVAACARCFFALRNKGVIN